MVSNAYDRLTAARGDIRRAAARARNALRVLYPIGCEVEFTPFGKQKLVGAVRWYRLNERSGDPELGVDVTNPNCTHPHYRTTYMTVALSRVLRVVTPGGTPCPPT